MTESIPAYTRKLLPGMPAPAFEASCPNGRHWKLAQGKTTLLIFYRGIFCSYCRNYLEDFERLGEQFSLRGIDVVFASADNETMAQQAIERHALNKVRVCHGLTNAQMQDWGIYQSAGNPETGQPTVFSEPALFLIKSDLSLSYLVLNSAPFGRPSAADMLAMIDFITEKGSAFPQRGNWRAPAGIEITSASATVHQKKRIG